MKKPTLKTYRRLFQLFVAIAFIVIPILNRTDYSYVYGNYLSFHLFGIPLADPLAVLQLSIKNLYLTVDNIIGTLLPLLLAFMLGTVFCSWLCAYGFLSEITQQFSKKIMPKGYKGWSIRKKGFLFKMAIFVLGFIGFFVFSTTPILNQLSVAAWYTRFFQYLFGQDIVSLCFLFILALLLIEFIAQKRLWCRYICPQSVLIALTKILNRKRLKISFTEKKCICKPGRERCVAACTLFLNPKTVDKVVETECSNCGDCYVACQKMGKALAFEFPQTRGLLERLHLKSYLPRPRTILISLSTLVIVAGISVVLFQMYQNKESTNERPSIDHPLLSNKKISWKNSNADYFELLPDGTLICVGGDWPINGYKGWLWEPVDENGSFKIIPNESNSGTYRIVRVADKIGTSTQLKLEYFSEGKQEKPDTTVYTIDVYDTLLDSHAEQATTMDAKVVVNQYAEEVYVLHLSVLDPGGKKLKKIYTEGDHITTEGMLTAVHKWINSPEIIVSEGSSPQLPIHTKMELLFHDGHTESAIFETTAVRDHSSETFDDPWF